jgi:hypothetical protein
MFDYVVVLDESLRCPEGHQLDGFQSKSCDHPAMETYLLSGPCVYLVARRGLGEGDDNPAAHWRLDGTNAVYTRQHAVSPITVPNELVFYTTCDTCAPVLVRSDHARTLGDLLAERRLWVEFRATFGAGSPRRIDRTSGTRTDLIAELRAEGLRVLGDDEPLAIAHLEIRAARDARPPRRHAW